MFVSVYFLPAQIADQMSTIGVAMNKPLAASNPDAVSVKPADLNQHERQRVIEEQRQALAAMQRSDGHIVFELEADATIPAEYILLLHFLGNLDRAMEAKMAAYLRQIQNDDGSWPLYHQGAGNLSASVKAYWALKLTGEDIEAPPMKRARDWILRQGGAARANVFTRTTMALFGEIPWRGVPVMPVEIMLLPRWFPFHLSKVAYWSRTVMVPMFVLLAKRAKAVHPTGLDIRELFCVAPEVERHYNVNPTRSPIGAFFLAVDKVLRKAEPHFPAALRRRAIQKAMDFTFERLNGEDGLGAIFPAMANAVMAMQTLGMDMSAPQMVTARRAIDLLIVEKENLAYCQPCVSPVWDSSLSAHALLEAGEKDDPAVVGLLDWLQERQILDVRGDWTARRPDVRPGGWAFQYQNPHFPDVDDTAVVAMAMHRQGDPKYAEAIDRACEWLVGMQSASGGWGAFEPENEHFYLNAIPFADHGALLDPPTVDVTARCVGCLAQIDAERYAASIALGISFIKTRQEPDGSWFGRWGANYIYGTWSVLVALNRAGEDNNAPYIQRAIGWLKAAQRSDGGWGEGLESYETERKGFALRSTASQTAWAVLALISAGEVDSEAVEGGIDYLSCAKREGARWQEELFTGTGFPRVFYLKYAGYAAYFPLWALARYQRVKASNAKLVAWGI